ncbi:MAG: hypothetical protein JKY37_15620 [Nannocystaceae bacterium]|nr:hypothetical protein [Nannocystaceae bacterium]
MRAVIEPFHAFTACGGTALVVGRGSSAVRGFGDVHMALAAILGAREADGDAVRVVVLRIARRDDAAWAREALDWLAERGRRVVLRTAVVLSRELQAAARRWGCTILLELAHRRPKLSAALLGATTEPAAALLLHAQLLRRVGLEVAVHLAPLLPVVHEDRDETVALLRHIAAADIRDIHLTVGRLTRPRWESLRAVLPRRLGTSMLRTFGLDAGAPDPFADVPLTGQRLVPLAMASLYHAIRLEAQSEGLRIDHCGCPAQCHLDPQVTPDYVPLLTPDLFADAG